MAINYKKELENAAKSMILVHEPELLIKMIVRTIVQKVKVSHAAILLHDEDKDTYIFTVSRGPRGLKVPAGFVRMDKDNPLIKFFAQKLVKKVFGGEAFISLKAEKLLKQNIPAAKKRMLRKALYQMGIFEAQVAIPGYFRNDLLGILLLGEKRNKRSFLQEELDFFIALNSDVAMAIKNAYLFKGLTLELEKNRRLFLNTTDAFAKAIDAKDHYTHGHTSRVTALSLNIARQLGKNCPGLIEQKFLENLNIASLLHDIGKIGITEAILNKEGPLNEAERIKMQEHPLVGTEILKPIKELEVPILGIKYHHEKFDGSGYPEGLKGEEIPLIAAIIAVADTFDAMTTDRPYRRALSKERAVEEIRLLSGKQFNPRVVESFLEIS